VLALTASPDMSGAGHRPHLGRPNGPDVDTTAPGVDTVAAPTAQGHRETPQGLVLTKETGTATITGTAPATDRSGTYTNRRAGQKRQALQGGSTPDPHLDGWALVTPAGPELGVPRRGRHRARFHRGSSLRPVPSTGP
jgi:hypothetical protein